jgi:hypothetical protein
MIMYARDCAAQTPSSDGKRITYGHRDHTATAERLETVNHYIMMDHNNRRPIENTRRTLGTKRVTTLRFNRKRRTYGWHDRWMTGAWRERSRITKTSITACVGVCVNQSLRRVKVPPQLKGGLLTLEILQVFPTI